MSEKVKVLQESWLRCYEYDIPKNLSSPRISSTKEELDSQLEKYEKLITIFNEQLHNIEDYYSISNMFLVLTDSAGMVLSLYCTEELGYEMEKINLKKGVYLTEEICGTNAISLAMIKRGKIKTRSKDYYCSLFQGWNSIAAPVQINNNIIGYLNISMKNKYKKGIDILLDHLISKTTLTYINDTLFYYQESKVLNKEEYEILKYTALGYSIKEISQELYVSQSSVKYRRKILCQKLEATNIVHAVALAFAKNIIKITNL